MWHQPQAGAASPWEFYFWQPLLGLSALALLGMFIAYGIDLCRYLYGKLFAWRPIAPVIKRRLDLGAQPSIAQLAAALQLQLPTEFEDYWRQFDLAMRRARITKEAFNPRDKEQFYQYAILLWVLLQGCTSPGLAGQ